MKLILGKKIGMLQFFDKETARAIPVTVVEAGPVLVTAIKSVSKDGYSAFQIGFGQKKSSKKPQRNLGKYRILREFRVSANDESKYQIGDKITLDIFAKGEKVSVAGVSKGRGFAGVVKRHGFAGGPKSHGQKHRLRAPGSLGATTPQRVIKGRRMAGHMGSERIVIRKLPIIDLDLNKNFVFLKGAVPGFNGSLLEIYQK